jgi:hypothetical protein
LAGQIRHTHRTAAAALVHHDDVAVHQFVLLNDIQDEAGEDIASAAGEAGTTNSTVFSGLLGRIPFSLSGGEYAGGDERQPR